MLVEETSSSHQNFGEEGQVVIWRLANRNKDASTNES
jgi:hypothetical protein